jgi:hypothetical protein
MTKIFLFVLAIFFLVGCNGEKTTDQVANDKLVIKPIDQEISTVSYTEAIQLYGKPISSEVFDNAQENEVFPGIRAGIAKHFSAGVKVRFKEAIWLKNDSTYIAVWYTEKQNKWIPFDSFEYGKGVDF